MAFCTDDREPEHVADDGHINAVVREAVELGLPPEDAVVMASLNPASYHGLDHLGAIAPGRRADVLVLSDLESFMPELVLKRGRPVGEIEPVAVPDWVRNTVHLGAIAPGSLAVPWNGGRARVIGLVPDQIITASLEEELATSDGVAVADPARDLAKIAVFERHLQTGRVAVGFVRGFGLERGAFGSSVAHDAHNLVVAGVDDASILTATERLRELGGGLVVVDEGAVLAELPLPVAGLLSDRPLGEVLDASREVAAAIRALGVSFPQPVQMLAFLSLSVIPSLKITDRGLVDVERFELVPLAV
jgi:adenine deaminase